jgi:hypothetical protein
MLTGEQYSAAERFADALAEDPTTLSEPRSRYLGEGVRELRSARCG